MATILLLQVSAALGQAEDETSRPAQDRTPEPPAVQPPQKAVICSACHGSQGNSIVPAIPALAGQSARYIYLQLRDFQEGRRSNESMSPMVKDLSRDDMHALADYFAAQKLVLLSAPRVRQMERIAD